MKKAVTTNMQFSVYASAAVLTAALCMPEKAQALPYVTIYKEAHSVSYQAPQHTRNLPLPHFYHASMKDQREGHVAFASDIPGDLQISLSLDEESPVPLAYAYDGLSLIAPKAKISAHYTEMNASHQFDAPLGFSEYREEKPDIITYEQREAYGLVVNFEHDLTDKVAVHHYAGIMVGSDGEKTPVASSKISFSPDKDLTFSVESNYLPDLSVKGEERTEIIGSISFKF